MESPKLIEPGVSYFFNNILKSCHETNVKYRNFIINLSLFFLLFLITYVILKYKKNNKSTYSDKIIKENKKKMYIIEKMRMFNNNKLKQRNQLITDYPPLNNF